MSRRPKDTVKKEVNTKGKEDVLCKYCDKVMRKDKVGKHFKNNHKDRKEKGEKACFKYIAAGTPGLEKFGFVQKKDEKKDDANDDNDDLDNSEDNFDQSNIVPEVEEVGEKKRQHDDDDHDDDDGERSKKKVKSSILDDFKKLLDKKMDDNGGLGA